MSVSAAAVTAEQTQAVRACLFTLAGEPFAVALGFAREVVSFEGYTIVPGAPPPLLGVANLRGTVMPIFDLRPLLGFPPHPVERRTNTLILGDRSLQAAIAIDAVLGLETFEAILPLSGAAPAVPEAIRAYGAGRLRRGDRPAVLLDAPKVLEAFRRAMGRRGADAGTPP
jgi:purine-binding chemotaxis protein CheW